jgi:hypothetical protein
VVQVNVWTEKLPARKDAKMPTTEFPLILWIISCFDKRREKPFPVYNRSFRLNWDSLSESEQQEVLEILAEKDGRSTPSPSGLGTAVVTLSRTASKPDLRMLKFRGAFVELDEEALKREWEKNSWRKFVDLNTEYFEDETGKRISDYEMIQHVSGDDQPVIIGDSKSVMKLGPSTPTATADWTTASANTISQFLNVIERIYASAWFAGAKSISYEVDQNSQAGTGQLDTSKLLEALYPSDEETIAVLAYFRQLHAGDKLFVKAVECYKKYCGDQRKVWWIDVEKQQFEKLIDSQPRPFNVPHTMREIIKMFMYGAGLLHSALNDGADKQLIQFIQSQGRHNVVAIFNHCLMEIFAAAVPSYHVIWHDFGHWLKDHGLTPPERQDIKALFADFPRKPDAD